jgi:hypothetical protein
MCNTTAEEQGIQSLVQIRLPQKTKRSIHIQYHPTTRERGEIDLQNCNELQ